MAKNFVEEGKTVAIVASAAISSGDLVQVGDIFAVALTDIPQGETGDGMTEGVFMLPKLKTDDMKTGKKVYLKSGKVQLTGGVTVRISIWIIWRPQGCIRCRCQRRSRAMCCCAVLVHRCRIMPPFTVVTASCCTIFLNN